MLLDPMGGIVLTNDGHAILREIDVTHPAAKSMLELARAQDENVGDGTTSVIILAGELLEQCKPYLQRNMHPQQILAGLNKGLEVVLKTADQIACPIDVENREEMLKIVQSCIGTKLIARWMDLMTGLALDAVSKVNLTIDGRHEIDIKRFVRIEKIPGGEIEDSHVMNGIVVNKDVTHSKMRRFIKNPRIMVLDCNLEYKKGESQTNVMVQNESDWNELLTLEEEAIREMCNHIIACKPDVVFTEKGVSDLAQHYLVKENITAIRRLRKGDALRLARACGATICHRPEDVKEADIGTQAGVFKIEKIGDEYFTFVDECVNPKACTMILRGAGKDVLAEIDRNLQDAMNVVRNVMLDPRLLPGGGAFEIAASMAIAKELGHIDGEEAKAHQALEKSLEIIPTILMKNCGANVIRTLTKIKAQHSESSNFGVNGKTGKVANMTDLGVWEPFEVKVQAVKTAVESACMLLRIDDVVSGLSNAMVKAEAEAKQAQEEAAQQEQM
eukprot:TRINITY_DN60_c0_g1_i1.p1 TRINITY_DN60_c0_g1~~TRINITY_DN60_c0_g1_i1.p1  ORF type:complete len:501 (+),score=206.64 TRINITY_DN60_c0_g1_i1:144-1646(+)